MDEVLKDFLTESHESLELIDVGLGNFKQGPGDVDLLNNIFRLVHTIKGTCGFLNLPRLEVLCHATESMIFSFRIGAAMSSDAEALILKSVETIKQLLQQIEASGGIEPPGDDNQLILKLEMTAAGRSKSTLNPSEPSNAQPLSQVDLDHLFDDASHTEIMVDQTPHSKAQASQSDIAAKAVKLSGPKRSGGKQTLRVKSKLLEQLVSHVTDLIATRAQLLEIARRSDDHELKISVNHLADIVSKLQKVVVETRVQPIGTVWKQLLPMTRELAIQVNKEFVLVLDGEEIEVDCQILDLIKAPMAHLVRNCADHGLEATETRVASQKPLRGTIAVTAVRQGCDIVLEVLDDGQGLDIVRIKQKAIDQGIIDSSAIANMDETQVAQLIFEPGFSTLDEANRLSGRGMGLDVVRNSIEKTGGSIQVHSVRGEGTVFIIKIPATPAQISSLILAGTKDHEKILLRNIDSIAPVPVSHIPSQSGSTTNPSNAAQSEDDVSEPRSKTKILFLEENPFFEKMLTPIIEAGGYDLTVVRSASEALAQLADDKGFLAVISDLDAPDNTGFSFAQKLKEAESFADTPLIAVSSLATSISIRRAQDAGYDHCLAKFDRNGLLSCLNKITYRLKVAA